MAGAMAAEIKIITVVAIKTGVANPSLQIQAHQKTLAAQLMPDLKTSNKPVVEVLQTGTL